MKTLKVWDIFIRVFHWSLVASIIIQIITAESLKKVHVNVGYFILYPKPGPLGQVRDNGLCQENNTKCGVN